MQSIFYKNNRKKPFIEDRGHMFQMIKGKNTKMTVKQLFLKNSHRFPRTQNRRRANRNTILEAEKQMKKCLPVYQN